MAGRSHSQSEKLTKKCAAYLALLPIGQPVSLHDAARRLGRMYTTGLLNTCTEPRNAPYVDVDGRDIIRTVGTFDLLDVEIPYRGTPVPFRACTSATPAKGEQRAMALYSSLKVDSLVVWGRAFQGVLVVERADGAVLRPDRPWVSTVRTLWRRQLLTAICSDDFAHYLSVTLMKGSSIS